MTIDRVAASEAECRALPYVGLEHIEKGAGNFAADFRCLPETLLATKFRFTPQHVLYGKLRPNLNKVVLPDFDGVCTTEIFPLLPKTQALDRGYLYGVLLSHRFVKWASNSVSGANLPRLDPARLRDYEIELPDLTQQLSVARQLEQTHRLRRTRRYALELTDSFLPAAFLELFGDPKQNPNKWPERTLSAVCSKFSDGPFGSNLKSSDYRLSGIRVIRLQNIGVGEFLDDDVAFVSKEHFASLQKHTCIPGDVLIGTMGEPNLRACIQPVQIPIALNKADCIQARPDPKQLDALYLQVMLNIPSTLHLVPGMVHGQTRGRVSMGELARLPIPVPPLQLQEEFAALVQRVERLRAVQREALRQAEHLFASLLARAFSS
jgi:type I restriction enzyme S subunit